VGRLWTVSFGRNVRTLRERQKLTQTALAKAATVSIDTVQNWENGPNAPTTHHQDVLAGIFGVPVERLWERTVLLVPELDVGVHCFPSPPGIDRESMIVEPIMRKLNALKFDRYVLTSFSNVRTAIAEQMPQLHEQQQSFKSELLEWAKAARRALILLAFRPERDEEWGDYLNLIGLLKYDSCIVVVQAVDPFHAQPILRTTSRYVAKVYSVEMNFADFPPTPDDLKHEIPPCCYDTVLSVFNGDPESDGRECVSKLIEARILSRENDRLIVQCGTEPQWRGIPSND